MSTDVRIKHLEATPDKIPPYFSRLSLSCGQYLVFDARLGADGLGARIYPDPALEYQLFMDEILRFYGKLGVDEMAVRYRDEKGAQTCHLPRCGWLLFESYHFNGMREARIETPEANVALIGNLPLVWRPEPLDSNVLFLRQRNRPLAKQALAYETVTGAVEAKKNPKSLDAKQHMPRRGDSYSPSGGYVAVQSRYDIVKPLAELIAEIGRADVNTVEVKAALYKMYSRKQRPQPLAVSQGVAAD